MCVGAGPLGRGFRYPRPVGALSRGAVSTTVEGWEKSASKRSTAIDLTGQDARGASGWAKRPHATRGYAASEPYQLITIPSE